ncbi:hypothetical protein BDQ17DRAFT_293260 [Cyathus striatus]|nr:hypothetical protein BDQ17DRAFT_293260 [Cyathus striatus]
MTGKTEIAPGVYIAASCRKQWYMWNTCEGTYSPTQIADKSVFLPIVPNAMIREVNMLLTPEKQDKLSWNVDEDNMILRYYYSRGDIVLESPVPGICPHIVITLAQDTVEDYYIPFSNRVDPQWPDFLIVPPYFDVSLSRLFLHPQQSFENDISQEFPPTCTVSSQFYPSGLLPVFSATRFDKYIFETSNERNRVSSVVTVVQKLQIRVAAIAAASLAISLRDRYDDPSYLPLFEPSFCWTDPAEPIIVTTKRILGTIFIESPSPFTIPHIIINSPPPQDPYIPWMNGTNSPQDAGFGRYLTVPLRHANYINQSHQSYESSWSWDEISLEPCVSDDDLVSEADSLSLPDTPQQSTFVAEFDSYGKGDRTLRLPSITSGNYSLFDECPPISESMFELPKILEKWPRGEDEGWNSLSSDSEDSDDDLPPFDEWYQNIASRTVSPA